MNQLINWLVVIGAIAMVFWVLVREKDRQRNRTVEEFERDFAAGQGKLTQSVRAGALGLESILIDEKREAIAHKKDEERGTTKTGSKSDDADRTEPQEVWQKARQQRNTR